MNNIYLVITTDGRKFFVESYEDYQRIFTRYKKRFGDNLACVLKMYIYNSIDEIKKERMKNEVYS